MLILEKLLPLFSLRKLAVALAIVWSLFNGVAFGWHMVQHEKDLELLVREVARATLERDILYRQWNAGHGGLYAPITKKSPPNPYILPAVVPERDETTLSGRQLTLINPACMTRQIQDFAKVRGAISGHITSLNPINPANQPLPWEVTAMRSLAGGGKEYADVVEADGERVLRMLLPLWTEKVCLRCHGMQGYKEGDLRGGISVTLAVEPYHSLAQSPHRTVGLVHLGLWCVGVMGIFWGYRAMAPREAARRAAEEQILNLAYFDGLTGLVNRQLFQDRLQHSLAIAKRYGNRLGLLYMDLDHFKPINDQYGHEAGDQVLVEAGRRLQGCVRTSDTAARIGGDEFAVLLEGLAHRQEAALVARRIIEAFERPFVVAGTTCHVGVSVGISSFPEDGDDLDTLVGKADKAMYSVKTRQRGECEFA